MSRFGRGLRSSELYAENHGWRPKGPWWQKALATIIACVLIILLFAVISFIGTL